MVSGAPMRATSCSLTAGHVIVLGGSWAVGWWRNSWLAHWQVVAFRGDWCFQVCRDEVHKDRVPDLPYLNATTWASHEFLHNPTAHDPPGTMTCPAVKLQDVAPLHCA